MIACGWVHGGCNSEGIAVADHHDAHTAPRTVCLHHASDAEGAGWSVRRFGAAPRQLHSAVVCTCETPSLSGDTTDWSCIACTRLVLVPEAVSFFARQGHLEAAGTADSIVRSRARVRRARAAEPTTASPPAPLGAVAPPSGASVAALATASP